MYKLSKKTQINRKKCIVIGSFLAVVFLMVDVFLPMGVASGELYVILILIGLLALDRVLIMWAAAAGILLTVAGFALTFPGESIWMGVINRFLSITIIVATVILCLVQNRFSKKLFEERDKLITGLRASSDRLKIANNLINQDSAIIQLQKDIAVFSNQNKSFEDAMYYSLKRVCEETGWPVGHLCFTAENPEEGLISSRIWYFDDKKRFEKFRKITEVSSFPPGIGLPGRVLSSGKPEWIENVNNDASFRGAIKSNVEVRGGFAFPVLVGEDVVGVMEFFSSRVEEPNNELLEVMENIGMQIGRVVERKKAEEGKNRLLCKLEERVKYLTCLYGVASSVRKIETRENLFKDITSYIIPAWQYPEITRVRILFDGKEYISKKFKRTLWRQVSAIVINGKQYGSIEIYYIEERPKSGEGPFLREERKLLDELAKLLGEAFERKWVQKKIVHSQKQLRQLSRRIELVREEERTRIAREVHDELGQVLTTLKLELSLMSKKLLREQNGFYGKTQRMLELMDQTIQTVKRISSDLRPPILDVFGLSEAIQWQGKEFQNRTGIRFGINSRPDKINLDQDRSTTVFRIFQEILTNVARHANATKIFVNLIDDNNVLTLKVQDNGAGITEKQILDLKSLGILGMRERALVWGGDLDLSGVQNRGTTVTIGIPH